MTTEIAAPPTRRERSRAAKTRRYLEVALRIVDTDGFDALTMQRVSDDCDAATGAIYRYFPTKGALVAEVQAEAIRRLSVSYDALRATSDRALDRSSLSEEARTLARMYLFAHFIIACADAYPQELHLLQLLMTDWPSQVPIDEGHRVVPVAFELLSRAVELMQECMDAEVLSGADAAQRTVTWAASLSGVLLLSTLQEYSPELFRGQSLAGQLSHDLMVGWSADPATLADAEAFINRYRRREPLAPLPPETES